MGKIAIVTDSNSGITQDEGRELGVSVLPMPFYINDVMYLEGITLSQEAFYERLKNDETISTSQPSPAEVCGLWDNLLKEYDEVVHIVKALDTMIDHMGIVVVEVPNLVLMAQKLIPKRIEEILATSKEMIDNGYNLEYLNIEYNMEECNKNINTIMDRIRVLNLVDCMFDLKTMLDYLDTIFNSFDEERLARKSYEEMVAPFEKKLRKTNRIMKDIYNQLDDIKNMYVSLCFNCHIISCNKQTYNSRNTMGSINKCGNIVYMDNSNVCHK